MNPSRELLDQIFTSLPEDQRVAFLEAVYKSISPQQQSILLAKFTQAQTDLDDTVSGYSELSPRAALNTGEPNRGDHVRSGADHAVPAPATSPAGGVPKGKRSLSEAEKQALINRELSVFTRRHEAEMKISQSRFRREAVSCLLWVVLAIAVLLALSVAGREVYDWMVNLLGFSA